MSQQPKGGTKDFERIRGWMRSRKSLPRAIVDLRREYEPDTLLRFVPLLAAHPSYRALIGRHFFPSSLEDLVDNGFPYLQSFQKELAWLAGLLEANATRIETFVEFRDAIEKSLFTAKPDVTIGLLDQCDTQLGASLWSLDIRMSCIQLSEGSIAKNNLFAASTSGQNGSSILKYIASWLAFRSGSEISKAAVDRYLEENASDGSSLSNLIGLALGKWPVLSGQDAAALLGVVDTLPLVDRYLVLLHTLQALDVDSGTNRDETLFASKVLKRLRIAISDERLERLAGFYGPTSGPKYEPRHIGLIDSYTLGAYDLVIENFEKLPTSEMTVEAVYISLRAAALNGTQLNRERFAASPLILQVLGDLEKIIHFTPEGIAARSRLEKLVQTFSMTSWASSIAHILARQRNDERAFPPTREQSCLALRVEVDQPILALANPRMSENYLGGISTGRSQSPSHLVTCTIAGLSVPPLTDVPGSRVERVSAFRSAKSGDFDAAIETLECNIQNPKLIDFERRTLLVRLSLMRGEIGKSTTLAADLFMESDYFGSILPLKSIIEPLLNENNLPFSKSSVRGQLATAIIFDVYSKYVSTVYDAELADSFNDILRKHNVSRASDLAPVAGVLDQRQLEYFLREICVPDILDQSLYLTSTLEVENERAAILIWLSEINTHQEAKIAAEIKEELSEIRTRQVLKETTLQLDQSKVYVNIEGIRRNIDITMRESWNRYRLAFTQGSDDDVLEKIKEIMRTATGDRLRVLDLRSPMTEGGALFYRMFDEIRDQFTSNKEFGLNSNLSTNIRHGYVLREIRSPLVDRNLITNRKSEGEDYLENSFWLDRIDPGARRAQLSEALLHFANAIDSQITDLTQRVLQIVSNSNPTGLFYYEFSASRVQYLEAAVRYIDNFDEFMEKIFDVLWDQTERNLVAVRKHLDDVVATSVNRSLTELEATLRQFGFEQDLQSIFPAIALARQDERTAIDKVSSWFTLSRNQEYQDYDISIAVQAGLQSVRSYYRKIDIDHQYAQNVPFSMKGWTLPVFSRLFFLILDNAAYHGGGARAAMHIETSVTHDLGSISLEIANDLPDDVDLEALEERIRVINSEYGQAKAADKLGTEGGSGYPKMWKLLNFDLRLQHAISVSIANGHFKLQIICVDEGVVA